MSKRLVILVYILITALVVGGGVYIYQSGRVEAQKEKIESLENSSRELREEIASLEERGVVDKENGSLSTTKKTPRGYTFFSKAIGYPIAVLMSFKASFFPACCKMKIFGLIKEV